MPRNSLHFSISERRLYLRFLDVCFMILGLFFLSYIYDFEYFNFSNSYVYVWLLVLFLYYYFFGEIFELFDLKIASDRYLTLKSLMITVVFTTLFYVFTPKISPVLPPNRLQIVYFSLTLFVSVLINRFIYILFIFAPRFLKNILLIGDSNAIELLLGKVDHNQSNRFVGYVSNSEIEKYPDLKFSAIQTTNIEKLVTSLEVNEILVSPTFNDFNSKNVNVQLIELFEKGMSIRSVDSFLENETFKVSENQLISNFNNYFSFSNSHENNLYLTFGRIFELLFSIIGIVLLVLLIPFILLFNMFGNKGKLFYTQKRVGKNGKQFTIIKFRSMVSNAEKNGAEWSKIRDVRITPFGKILRKTRIDEIPQFINVLKGEMSLIGPRPERPEFVTKLENDLPYYALRHVIKPGLTGWAQVMHPYARSVKDQQEKLLFDLYYIKERNIILDLKIIIKTINTILFFRGS